MNNSTVNESKSTCGFEPSYWETCKLVIWVTYTIIPPFCLLIGLPSHLIALIAFLRHRNSDTGYSYQILTGVTKIFEIVGMFLFSMFFYNGAGQDWSGEGTGDGAEWFLGSYWLMRFTAHVLPPMAAFVSDLVAFSSAAMAADRAFALSLPFRYQSKNHSMHFLWACLLCFSIPLMCELHLALSFTVVRRQNSTKYSIEYGQFSGSSTNLVWTNVTAAIRSIAELTLIVCSIFMIYRFKRRNLKVQQLSTNDARKEATRKANERTLFYLALFQCTANTLPGFLITAWDVTNYFQPSFVYCDGVILSPITDLVLQVVNAIDVYFMICVSTNFRRMIVRVLNRESVTTHTPALASRATPHGEHGRSRSAVAGGRG